MLIVFLHQIAKTFTSAFLKKNFLVSKDAVLPNLEWWEQLV